MSQLLLRKEELGALVAGLLGRHRVVAPVWRDGELRFAPLATPAEVVLDYRNTSKPAKSVLLPQVECLLRFERARDHYNQGEAAAAGDLPTVVLGIRPCDTRSLVFMDAIFGQGRYTDPAYLTRRRNTVLFAMACDQPRQTCFCHALGSGPYDQVGADVFMREAGDAYVLEAASERGHEILAGLNLPAADADQLAKAQEVEATAQAQLGPIEPVAGIEETLDSLFDSEIWREIAEKCLACGTCTFACPTCHCFNIEDRVQAGGGERVRAWDACMFPSFTLHASGHNPRPDQAARWRQRTMHKFNYLPRNVSLYGCVGCGRCVTGCPVSLDIRRVLERVRQAGQAHEEAGAQEKR